MKTPNKRTNPKHARLAELFARLTDVRYESRTSGKDENDAACTIIETDSFLAGICQTILEVGQGRVDQDARMGLLDPVIDGAGVLRTINIPPKYIDLHRWPQWLAVAELEEEVRLECVSVLGLKPPDPRESAK